MHRSGNPRFDCAVSTGGARGPRVDHPSSEGVVLISPLAETNRKAASHRYALAGTVGTVARKLEKLGRRLPIDWCFATPITASCRMTC